MVFGSLEEWLTTLNQYQKKPNVVILKATKLTTRLRQWGDPRDFQ